MAMLSGLTWQQELQVVDDLMRAISIETDPEAIGQLYGDGIDKLYPSEEFMAISRRFATPPYYHITRSNRFPQRINPWTQRHLLPHFSGGVLGELLYSNKPTIVEDFHADPADPAYEYLKGIRAFYTLPHYDNGESLNMGIMLFNNPERLDKRIVPGMVMQANLFGRSTLNHVLRQQLTAANEAMDRELKTVGLMQQALLPKVLPDVPRLKLAAHYRTAQRAGGDSYDIFPLPDGRWGMFIADVAGHGTPAAVMMAMTHALTHANPPPTAPPGVVMQRLNSRLHDLYLQDTGYFITAFYCIFDPAKLTLTYARAGHNPPRLCRNPGPRGHIIALDACNGLPLGIMGDSEYPSVTIQLQPGDILCLYTDGIVEASAASDRERADFFDLHRLDAALMGKNREAQSVCDAIVAAVDAYSQTIPPADDQTLFIAVVE
jgi:phosphoserine phosphatase RsbU/P